MLTYGFHYGVYCFDSRRGEGDLQKALGCRRVRTVTKDLFRHTLGLRINYKTRPALRGSLMGVVTLNGQCGIPCISLAAGKGLLAGRLLTTTMGGKLSRLALSTRNFAHRACRCLVAGNGFSLFYGLLTGIARVGGRCPRFGLHVGCAVGGGGVRRLDQV